MSAIRAVIAFGILVGGYATQSDATQAFVQPLLPEDVLIYIALNPELMSEEQKKKVARMKRP
eukprot:5235788-Amphidinium_carterae.1